MSMEVNNQNFTDMQLKIISDAWNMIKSKGFAFVLIFLALIYLYNENSKMQKKIDDCYQNNYEVLIEGLSNNTKALEDLKITLISKGQ